MSGSRRRRPFSRRAPAVAVASALVASASLGAHPLSPSTARAAPDRGLFLSILPPGQGGSVSGTEAVRFQATGELPAHFDDQLGMYDRLATAERVTDDRLSRWFKPSPLGLPERPTRVETPRDGVRIERDEFGVPHVRGDTRLGAMWGAGYVTAEDRLFFADVLRHVGRGRLSELLGASEANLALDRATYLVAGYSEEERARQVERANLFGALGERLLADAGAYVEGINARIREVLLDPRELPGEYAALQIVPEPWTTRDLVAVATVILAEFGAGGGGELRNAVLLQRLKQRWGARRGTALFSDLRSALDPETDVTSSRRTPFAAWQRGDEDGVALPDPDSVRPHDPVSVVPSGELGPARAIAVPAPLGLDPSEALRAALAGAGFALPSGMSNWLAVTAGRTAAGRPVGVMGPQVGYWIPQLLMEIDLSAPGVHARGVTFPGIGLYVLLGRGPGFGWSATSGGSDLVDVRAERLCEPGGGEPTLASTHYRHRGACVPMEDRTDTWVAKPTAAGQTPPSVVRARVLRTVHGPVFAFGTVGGAPVAFTRQRSTFLAELDSAPAFAAANTGVVRDARSFLDAFSEVTASLNWLYVDGRDVAFLHSGRYPVRAPGVHPDLPSWGTGRWEWRAFLPADALPRAVDPGEGWMVSWNNKPARGWRSADSQYSYGPVHRSQMLSARLAPLARRGNLTPADLVEVMADAATVDLRGQEVLPVVLRAIGDDASLARYLAILRGWVASGAHRVDRDGDGSYEDEAAVALMDAWWERMVRAVFAPVLDGLHDAVPLAFDDPNRRQGVGSAFQSGYYGHVEKAVRMALGQPVAGRYRVLRCADGTGAGCRDALRRSLRAAVRALGPDPGTWDADEAGDAIRYTPVGLVAVPTRPWQNRPTWQQVVQPAPR